MTFLIRRIKRFYLTYEQNVTEIKRKKENNYKEKQSLSKLN